MRHLLAIPALTCAFLFAGCPSKTTQVKKQPVKTVKKEDNSLPPPEGGGDLPGGPQDVPKNVVTMKLKKGLPLVAYLHDGKIMKKKNPTGKKWIKTPIPYQGKVSWYLKVDPNGNKLGRFIYMQLIIACYAGQAGFKKSAFLSLRILLRRDGKEQELFRSMLRASGNRYQGYTLVDRELSSNPDLKKGDVLIFRVVHKKGANGVVGMAGGTDFRSSQVHFSHTDNYRGFTQ